MTLRGSGCRLGGLVAACTFCLLSVVARAGAQASSEERPLQVGAGYQFAHTTQEQFFKETFKAGLNFQVSRDLRINGKNAIGVVGNYGVSFHSDADESDRLSSFLVGVRFRRVMPVVSPYVIGLVGLSRLHASGGTGANKFSDSESGMTFGIRAGAQVKIDDTKSLYANVDEERISFASAVKYFGFEIGIVVYLLKNSS